VELQLQMQQAIDGFRVPWALHKLPLAMHSIKAHPSGVAIESGKGVD